MQPHPPSHFAQKWCNHDLHLTSVGDREQLIFRQKSYNSNINLTSLRKSASVTVSLQLEIMNSLSYNRNIHLTSVRNVATRFGQKLYNISLQSEIMNNSLLVRNHTTHNPLLTRVRNLKTPIIKFCFNVRKDPVFPHHLSISNDSNIIHVRPLSKCLDIFRKSIDFNKLDTQCTVDWLCTSYKVLVEVDLYRNKINFSILKYECVSVCQGENSKPLLQIVSI